MGGNEAPLPPGLLLVEGVLAVSGLDKGKSFCHIQEASPDTTFLG